MLHSSNISLLFARSKKTFRSFSYEVKGRFGAKNLQTSMYKSLHNLLSIRSSDEEEMALWSGR